jgi:hypothetical protein
MEKKHYIIKFVEHTYTVSYYLDIAPQYAGSETFLVSTRKIEEFVKEHDFEYGYVEHLVFLYMRKVQYSFKVTSCYPTMNTKSGLH